MEGVARLTIDNLGKRNALDLEILDAMAETLPGLDARCVIITGAERVFSAGYDIGDIPRTSSPSAPSPSWRTSSRGDRGARGLSLPDRRRGERPRDRRRARGGARLRPARGALEARMDVPPAKLGLIYPAYRPAQVHRRGRGLPRARSELRGRNRTRRALDWGSTTPSTTTTSSSRRRSTSPSRSRATHRSRSPATSG